MQDYNPIKTPTAMNFNKELYSAGDLLDESDKQLYQSLVSSLMLVHACESMPNLFSTGTQGRDRKGENKGLRTSGRARVKC